MFKIVGHFTSLLKKKTYLAVMIKIGFITYTIIFLQSGSQEERRRPQSAIIRRNPMQGLNDKNDDDKAIVEGRTFVFGSVNKYIALKNLRYFFNSKHYLLFALILHL